MKNTVEKHSDGINIYAEFSVKSNPIGKIILIILVFVLIVFFVLVFSTIDVYTIGKSIFPIVIMAFFLLVIPIRYLVWNLYGKENLIINSKTISYNYDYGIIKTNLKTLPFNILGTGIELIREDNGIRKGRLIFYDYREKDHLPEVIHYTSILVNLEEVKELDKEISKLFLDEFNQVRGFLPFSAN